ncbi:MAG: alanine dehydrogenase [Chloroflexota bacterium]|nr:alanine dehydrogenase [Chloroflexota bacterium]
MRYLSNQDVMAVLDMREALAALRIGYADLAIGDAAYVPRIDVYAPTGRDEDYYRWGSMTGVSKSFGVTAIRIKSDVVSWPDAKTEEKYCIEPGTYSGIILVYSIRNGEPLALINDGYLQHMRVGASAGLGAEVLARTDAVTLGMIGSGGMARSYLEAIAQVRPLREVRVYSTNPAHRRAYAEEMGELLKLDVTAVDSTEEAVTGADIVSTATDAMGATFDAAWVKPGAHITCVTRRELDKAIVGRADVVAQLGINSIPQEFKVPHMEWPSAGMAAYVVGQPEERARLPWSLTSEMGQYVNLVDIDTGRATGRTSDDQITLFINTGTQGLQFASVAGRVLQLAGERGLGQAMPTEWFLQDIRD